MAYEILKLTYLLIYLLYNRYFREDFPANTNDRILFLNLFGILELVKNSGIFRTFKLCRILNLRSVRF